MIHDLRGAMRSLTRAPGFALATILMLGVGIGVNTALFSVIDTVLLRPLPYDDPERAVTIWEYEKDVNERAEVSTPNYVDWRAQSTSFAHMALAEPYSFDYYGGREPAVWRGRCKAGRPRQSRTRRDSRAARAGASRRHDICGAHSIERCSHTRRRQGADMGG